MIAWNLTGNNLSVFLDGTTFSVSTTDTSFRKVMEAVENDDVEALHKFLNAKKTIAAATSGRISFDGNSLTFNGEPLHNAITTRLHYLWVNDLPYTALLRFMDRLMDNPSYRSVTELYRFLEACSLPITNDGYFLAYKRVRHDFKDIHSGTFDNSVGSVLTVTRNQVDEDPNRTCSHGLHVCSESYLPHFGCGAGRSDRVVVVKVDPADVVAVPNDYNNAKMRVCSYEVVSDVSDQYHDSLLSMEDHFTSSFSDEEFEEVEEFEDDYDYSDDDYTYPDLNVDPATHAVDDGPESQPKTFTGSVLSQCQVREIKRLLAQSEMSIVGIAKLYNVNESTIRKIKTGETWSWVS